MTSEIFISADSKKISTALTEDKRLMEFQEEAQSASYSVGNIYLARVHKLMPGLNASFISAGHQFSSLDKYLRQVRKKKTPVPIEKIKLEKDLPKEGSIQEYLQQGQEVLVQVTKEPISTKGPRMTCDISFPGRYLVLIPFHDKVSVSSKIKSSAERGRLKQVIQSIKPKNFGVIVRTVAENKKVAELDTEMKVLVGRWEETIRRVAEAKDLPTPVYEETSRAVGMLRDLFNKRVFVVGSRQESNRFVNLARHASDPRFLHFVREKHALGAILNHQACD